MQPYRLSKKYIMEMAFGECTLIFHTISINCQCPAPIPCARFIHQPGRLIHPPDTTYAIFLLNKNYSALYLNRTF